MNTSTRLSKWSYRPGRNTIRTVAVAVAVAAMFPVPVVAQTTMVVPLSEVPTSCGFPNGVPGSPASMFWNLWDSLSGDCSVGGPEIGWMQVLRTDSPAYVIQAGQLGRVYGTTLGGANCNPCCNEPDCDTEMQTLTFAGETSLHRQREWTITAGFEVTAGIKVGVPIIGAATVEASLSGATGAGGSTTLSESLSFSMPVLPCRINEVALTAQVVQNQVWAIDHSYEFQVRVHPQNPCPAAGTILSLINCSAARRSEIQSEGWDDLRLTVRVVDDRECDAP